MRNILTPKAYKIIDVRKESNLEYTFKEVLMVRDGQLKN